MMTLNDLIISDVDDVFLNTDDFAKEITWYPRGVVDDAELITVIDNQGRLEGTREVAGDGRLLNQEDTMRIRESVMLEMDATLDISVTDGFSGDFDQFLIDGQIYNAKRIMGRDDGMQQVLVVIPKERIARKSKRRG